jgi:uncharacterized protein YxjI
MESVFNHSQYLVRKKFFKIFGDAFHIYDESGNLAFYSKLKAFKLKEDIRIYTDESMQEEVLTIKARKIIDFSSAYDVFDPQTGEKIGACKRKGMKSILKDEWIFMDANDNDIGLIKEDSAFFAMFRRFVDMAALFLPQRYEGDIGGTPVCSFQQNFNPFVLKITLDFSADTQGLLDRRLGIAAAVLLCAIEGRQN